MPGTSRGQNKFGEISMRVAKMLIEEHYLKRELNDEMSEKVFDRYLTYLDFNHVYFLQSDIDAFTKKYRHTLDDALLSKDVQPAIEIYNVYKERVKSRVDLIKELAKGGVPSFDSARKVKIDREKEPYPADLAASDLLWKDLWEADLLQEILLRDSMKRAKDAGRLSAEAIEEEEKDAKETPEVTITKRYERILDGVNDNDNEDVAIAFIKALAHSYDPHTEYFSQQQYDNFRISMEKKLIGIGALLSTKDDVALIEGLVVGGPAHKQGELVIGDKVVGVAQGEDGKMVDVVKMKLNDIVEMIRGEEGTQVRLEVIPADSSGNVGKHVVTITRAEVDLKESLASAELILTKDQAGNPTKLGWIYLSSFYSDMGGGEVSTTADVQRLINRLTGEGVKGIVMDLRDNGGGSLEEAINLTGLFVPRGPIVQSKDWRSRVDIKYSRNRYPIYDGPLMVLTNRSSASASEIFAAALQDYNRAVIVGEKSSFGKGTVQQLRPVYNTTGGLLQSFTNPPQEGALKLTIQTFFRISGGSTQLKGVTPDVHMPSVNDLADYGEESLENPLPWETIDPATYEPARNTPLPFKDLQARTTSRIGTDQEFKYVTEDMERYKERKERNEISLNRADRESESKELEAIRVAREDERIKRFAETREKEKDLFKVYSLTQDNVRDEKLTLRADLSNEAASGMMTKPKKEDPREKALEYPHLFDPYKRETLRILLDFIELEGAPKPVNVSGNETGR